MFYDLTFYRNKHGYYTLTKTPLRFKEAYYGEHKRYSYKLNNNIVRAKSKIFDYIINNDFLYYVTLTMSNKYDRHNLKSFRKRINQLIRNMRRRGYKDLYYIFIPEKHKDGSYHMHGFLSPEFGKDLYINDNGFLSWSSYDYIGFSSVSKIKSYKACALYVTKYITKDLCKSEVGNYLYFHSRGLKTSKKICCITTFGLLPIAYDYENKFISKKLIDYYNFVTIIDYLKYNNKIESVSECNLKS